MRVRDEKHKSSFGDFSIIPPYKWARPPRRLNINVTPDGQWASIHDSAYRRTYFARWSIERTEVEGIIRNVRDAAEEFRATHEDYLNNIDSSQIQTFIREHYENPFTFSNEDVIRSEENIYEEEWQNVSGSTQLIDLALYGNKLYRRFFSTKIEGEDDTLMNLINSLPIGSRVNISWWKPDSGNHGSWIQSVPWGLMSLTRPENNLVNPLNFLGLRFRIEYFAYNKKDKNKSLGSIDNTYRIYLLYRGRSQTISDESELHRSQWRNLPNQTFVPNDNGNDDPSTELLRIFNYPEPNPVSLFYFFCRCKINGSSAVLEFGDRTNDIIRAIDINEELEFNNHPLIFANACTTVASDPYITNELEQSFFDRQCRAFIGTETKIPTIFASRFSSIFFYFFFDIFGSELIASGEAFTQSKIFLWQKFKNIGGLFYSYIGDYDLYLANQADIQNLPKYGND